MVGQLRVRNGVGLGAIVAVMAMVGVLLVSMAPGAAGTLAAASSHVNTAGSDATPSTGAAFAPAIDIQTEIDAAPAGSTVHLAAGMFVEQLQINKDLTLMGAGEGKTIVQSPKRMSSDPFGNVFVIEVGDHATVQITALTVRVTEQCMLANSIGVATGGGVGVRGNATLRIWDVAAVAYGPYPNLNQPCTTHSGVGMLSFGRAVSIGLDDGPGDGTNVQVEGHGVVQSVQTRGFDIFSISVGGVRGPSGSTATIRDNVVRVGPGPYTAAYGIVVYGVSRVTDNLVIGEAGSDGGIAVVATSAIVTDNTVLDFTCTNAPFAITPPCGIDPLFDDQDLGIFLASITPGTVVAHNSIANVDSGILIEGPGAAATISYNSVTDSTFYGLELINAVQTFRNDVIEGGPYIVAVGAASSNTTAVLDHDTIGGYTDAIALLEANYPWVAKVVIHSS